MRPPSPFDPPPPPGTVLRHARVQAGLSQEQLAERTGLAPSTISRLESGARAPQWPLFERALAALDLQPALGVETLDAHLHRQLDDELCGPPHAWFDDLSIDGPAMVRLSYALPDVLVIDGAAAARLHGLPLPVRGDLHFTCLRTDEAERALVEACATVYLSLHDSPDVDGSDGWTELFAMRPERLLLFRMVDQLPPATALLPPETEYFTPEPGRTVRAAQPGAVRLDTEQYRLLAVALARRHSAVTVKSHSEESQ